MPQYSVHFARFPFGRTDDPHVTDWLVRTALQIAKDGERINGFTWRYYDDTPITMTRGQAVLEARRLKSDYLLMVDNDMSPDLLLASNPNRQSVDPAAKPFWSTAWDFALKKREEGEIVAIAAPYCGQPPVENPFIFRWRNFESNTPDYNHGLLQYTREEAAERAGIEQVAALPTGLILMDMRCFDLIEPAPLAGLPPEFRKKHILDAYKEGKLTMQQAVQALEQGWFYYEWADKYASKKHSTEDVTFSRDLAVNGGKLYVAWDCWAGHWKRKCVGKPIPIYTDDISSRFRESRERGASREEKLVMVPKGGIKEAV